MANDQTAQSSFKRARKLITPLKISLQGISFSGKTMSAIKLAKGLAKGKDVFVIDSENGSAALYDHLDFLHGQVKPPFRPEEYIKLIREAVDLDAGAIVIDSGSHAWQYILDYKDQLDAAGGRGPQWSNWSKAKPLWQALKDAILQSPVHVIFCLREAAEYTVDSSEDGRGNKKSQVNKVGTKAKAEEGFEYEFTVSWKLDKTTHMAVVEKDRTGLFDGRMFVIDEGTGHELLGWLGDGEFVSSPEWELLRQGLSDEFTAASSDADKQRRNQALAICNARKISKEVSNALKDACKAAGLVFSSVVIDGDRYGATDADRLIRYICQKAGADPVPITRIQLGQEPQRVVSKDAAQKQSDKAAKEPEKAKEAPKTQKESEKAKEQEPGKSGTPTSSAPSESSSGPSNSEDEKEKVYRAIVLAVVKRGWKVTPELLAAMATELLNIGAIEDIKVLGVMRLQRLLEKLQDPAITPVSAEEDLDR